MTVQDARLALADVLTGLTLADGWSVTAETAPDIHDRTIVVGHPSRIAMTDSYRYVTVDLLVTAWVLEAESVDSVVALYDLLSPGPLSLMQRVPKVDRQMAVLQVLNVGPRDEGPTGFLAADLEVRMMVGP